MVADQKLTNIVLALAGIFQSALLVKNIAETGQTNETAFQASINSVYKIDAPDVPSVYGGNLNILMGLQELKQWCDKEINYKNIDVNRYVYSLMYLERKMVHDKAKSNILSRRVKQAISQANYFTGTHPTVLASLASIYIDLFGSYSFRIQVLGAAEVLNKVEIANKIRALLLAGIRSTVLWRQLGGGRLQVIFSRYKIFQITQQFILSIQSNKSMS